MRAAVVTEFGGPEGVRIVETEVPEPGSRQVRIKVGAAALNPVEALTRSGFIPQATPPLGLGWDVAGTIDAVGADAADWAVGDAVVALEANIVKPLGTHAEYVILDASAVAAAPTSVDTVHAATLPLNSLTAAQTLDLLDLKPGQTLLVAGAAGAVGGYAVELAAHQGVEVTGLASERDEELVRGLGAAHFVARGEAPGRRYDAVLDAANLGETALEWVRDDGAYAGVLQPYLPEPARGISVGAVLVKADGARLKELVAMLDAGVLTTRVAETYPLDEVVKAHTRLAEGGLRGKIVLVP